MEAVDQHCAKWKRKGSNDQQRAGNKGSDDVRRHSLTDDTPHIVRQRGIRSRQCFVSHERTIDILQS